jgi:hypothetical protein
MDWNPEADANKERVVHRFAHSRRYILVAAFLILAVTGCQTTMTTPPTGGTAATSSMSPLSFSEHDFDVHCYNTLRCKVIYANFDFNRSDADTPSPAPPPGDYRQHWRYAGFAGVPNFPPPADVHWTSLDGVAHAAKVDIGAIFKDQRALYNVPDEEIPDGSWGREPNIYLEVNDRTINVYMQSIVSTKTEQIPGNKHSNFRDDVILAWTHTY